MIYFDNAATGGFKPQNVLAAVGAAIKICANPGRSGHKLSVACSERVHACRRELMEFFGGWSCDRTIFTKKLYRSSEYSSSRYFARGRQGGNYICRA